jgi:hypothetical protein
MRRNRASRPRESALCNIERQWPGTAALIVEQQQSIMKNFISSWTVLLLVLITVYVGSYVVLRNANMRWATHSITGRGKIRTWVYFGDGDNFGSRLATIVYLPMHKAELAWLWWTGTPFAISDMGCPSFNDPAAAHSAIILVGQIGDHRRGAADRQRQLYSIVVYAYGLMNEAVVVRTLFFSYAALALVAWLWFTRRWSPAWRVFPVLAFASIWLVITLIAKRDTRSDPDFGQLSSLAFTDAAILCSPLAVATWAPVLGAVLLARRIKRKPS